VLLLEDRYQKLPFDCLNVWYHYATIIHNIKDLLVRDLKVKVIHTLQEKNARVDYSAKVETKNLEVHYSLVVPPIGINFLLLGDTNETLFSK
jgi:hypothetical protein